MWKLIDRLSGQTYEHKMRYVILELGKDTIKDYKRSGVETYIQYKGNCVYELKEYRVGGK